jgi:hypothetical protein
LIYLKCPLFVLTFTIKFFPAGRAFVVTLATLKPILIRIYMQAIRAFLISEVFLGLPAPVIKIVHITLLTNLSTADTTLD